jgi:glycosyltransferase involved in cell wall biosynthesis
MTILMGNIKLVLFFTQGISLRIWDETGMFDREVALYQRLQERGVQVTFITYGDKSDLNYSKRLPGIRILCNRWGLPIYKYSRWLPWLHAPWLCHCDVIKTNQTNGAEIALTAAKRWHKSLIARCGYMWSEFAINQNGVGSAAAQEALSVEKQVFRQARKVVVTTPMMASDIARRIPEAADRTIVIPNYVDTSIFYPANSGEIDYDIAFIGRLTFQKNVTALLDAIRPLALRTLIIGDGDLRIPLQQQFQYLDPKVQWLPHVSNPQISEYLARTRLFVLPSHYEGHPKTLIEAMACSLPVIGADSPGIRELIQHGENGWLCGTDPESIRSAIRELLASPDLCRKLGQNARKFVVEHFSLDRIVEMELQILNETVGQGQISSEIAVNAA